MSEDWDTSGNDEGQADPYNKSAFAGNTTPTAAGTEEIETGVSSLEVSEEAPAPPAATEAPAPPAATEAPAPPPPAATEAPAQEVSETSTEAEAPPTMAPQVIEVSTPPAAPAPVAKTEEKRSRTGSAPVDMPDFLKEKHGGEAFTEKLDPEALAFFNEVTQRPFSQQATAFLNAYWEEVGSQAEFMFSVSWPMIQYADMHSKGVQYIHLYQEGNDLDFNIGLYFYEKLCKKVLDDDEGKKWRDDKAYACSMPEMMTAIKRKVELREKVDVNFDGRVSFLEYLLYQYRDFANPADFTFRAMKTEQLDEHPEIVKARKALEEVNKAIQAYEAEKHRLEQESAAPGVKGLGAKHQLAILGASPLAEQLNKSLITAEAAVRIASRKFGDGKVVVSAGGAEGTETLRRPTDGSIWWMTRDLEEKKRLYGRRPAAK